MSDPFETQDPSETGKLNATVRRLKMSDIARLAGVSISTVSRSLAGSPLIPQGMRDKIIGIAREHGYVVNQAARALRLQTTRTIGIVLPTSPASGHSIADPFVLEMIGQLSEEISKRGYDILLSKIASPDMDWLGDLIQSNRFDGMVMLGQSDQHAVLHETAASYFPMVVWGEKQPGQNYCSVGLDNRKGGEMATRHLLETGRTSLRFVGPFQVPEGEARYLGFLDAHHAAGLTPAPPIECQFDHEAGRKAMQTLLAAGEPFDGIFAASDVIAHGAKTVFIEHSGVVPDGCAFVGFDDVFMAKYLSPPLTTIRQPLATAARTLTDLLFKRLSGQDTLSVIIPPKLIVRQTTSTRP